ncbi:hypothetical protein GGI19_005827, partial [Coemansia pectinata]
MLAFVLNRALIAVLLPLVVQMFLYLDSMPASRWTGVSQATFATLFVGIVVDDIRLSGEFGVLRLWMQPGLFVVAYIVINLDDMTFGPLAALSWLFRTLFGSKSSPSTTNQSSAQEQTPVVTDKAVLDPAVPEVALMSHSNLVDSIVAICRRVDEVAMYWIHLLSIIRFATGVAYYQEYNLSLLDTVNELPMGCICIIKSVAWLPQIIVNYKAKSGSLVPVVFVIHMLAYSIASTILYHLSGYNVFGETTAYSLPGYLSYIILILQWIMYRKV